VSFSTQFSVFLLCTRSVMSLTASVVAKRQGHVHFQILVYAVNLTGLLFIPHFNSALQSYSCYLGWHKQEVIIN